MGEHIVYYLTLISKLSDIINYIDENFKEDDISTYIKECKSLCINKIKLDPLIARFLDEIKEDNQHKENEADETKEKEEEEDQEMKETIDNLGMLMKISTGTDDNDTNLTPDMLDSLGNGLARLLKPDQIPVQNTVQNFPKIKNELNTINTNINFQIKKKNEH